MTDGAERPTPPAIYPFVENVELELAMSLQAKSYCPTGSALDTTEFAISEKEAFGSVYSRADRMFVVVMALQAVALLAMSLYLTPTTWSGTQSDIHAHVWISALMGLLITVFPTMLAIARPGQLSTRLVMAVSQGLVSGLLIHIGGGRVEMHFHIFVSLAFLAVYMDIKVLLAVTVVVATDHLVRGLVWPQSVYGISEAGITRTIEHAVWVIFEDIVLMISIHRARRERINLMGAVLSISNCVYAISGKRFESGNETKAIEEGLETIRIAMLRMHDSVGSVKDQSHQLRSKATLAVTAVNSGVVVADASRDSVTKLREAVQEISTAVAEINSIAEQTRLLSLNATIEAARSAEGGRGFGVVARNVKELAVKSGTAAARISKLTESCVQRVDESTKSTSSMLNQLSEIRDIVQSTDVVISDIRDCVTTSANDAEQMAAAFGGRGARRSIVCVSCR